MVTTTMRENANKLAFLAQQYPEHKLPQLLALFQMPAIDINATVWAAQELNFISEPDADTEEVKLLRPPKIWNFGPVEKELEDLIIYSFTQLAKKEVDLEENYMANWTAGYTGQDTLIAAKHLIEQHKLASYEIEDGENSYTFFTLYENSEQLWGSKQFKKPPVSGDKAE